MKIIAKSTKQNRTLAIVVTFLSLFAIFVVQSVHGQTPEPDAESDIDTSDWLEYEDVVLGFTVMYPPDWILHPSFEDDTYTNNASLVNYDITQPIEEGLFPQGSAKISFSISENQLSEVQDVEDYIQRYYLHPDSQVTATSISELSEFELYRFDLSLFENSWIYIYIPQDFKLLFISAAYTDGETARIVEAILATLTLVDPEEGTS